MKFLIIFIKMGVFNNFHKNVCINFIKIIQNGRKSKISCKIVINLQYITIMYLKINYIIFHFYEIIDNFDKNKCIYLYKNYQ